MKNLRKVTAIMLTAVLAVGILVVPGGNVQAAKKVMLNKKSITLEVGKKANLKLNNAPKKRKVTWSSNKKKIASVNKKGVVTAKKAGKANITAKVNGKKYVCKVTVKKKTIVITNTEGKNKRDVAALEKIIKEQNARGAEMPTDLNQKCTIIGAGNYYEETNGYQWNADGRLIKITLNEINLKGNLDLSEFTSLTDFSCCGNDLTGLDVSKNTALTYLACVYGRLSDLDVSNNVSLTDLYCYDNQLTSLDVSNNTDLTYLDCYNNQLINLDVSKNVELTYLECGSNRLTSLDVTNNTKLTALYYDEGVKVTGWPK